MGRNELTFDDIIAVIGLIALLMHPFTILGAVGMARLCVHSHYCQGRKVLGSYAHAFKRWPGSQECWESSWAAVGEGSILGREHATPRRKMAKVSDAVVELHFYSFWSRDGRTY